jgi:hypothetical protein
MKTLLKPGLFIQLLLQCAAYRQTTKALAQQFKAGSFQPKEEAKSAKGVHETTVETGTFHPTSRPVCSV